MSKYIVLILLGAALFIVILLVASKETPAPTVNRQTQTADQGTDVAMPQTAFTINLNEQNESGEKGTATLVEENGKVVVTVSLEGYPDETPQPAHIHVGSCPDVGEVKYPLTNVVNGQSVTTLNITLAEVESELPLGLNVHKSPAEAGIYTACGDL